MVNIQLPELGDGIEQATIACYHYKEGDQVGENDDVVEVVTDKATFNVPTTISGVIKKVCFQEGDHAAIGATLLTLEPLQK